jgi:hypothetical protein
VYALRNNDLNEGVVMTPEEKSLLEDFLNRLKNAPVGPADVEALSLIQHTADLQPAALYLTVQRALWLEQALKLAEGKIKTLEGAATAAPGNPWLSTTWGSGAGNAPLPPSHLQPNNTYAYGQMMGTSSGFLGGGGSFLGTMAATAAGVVAGEMIAESFSHHSSSHGFVDSDVNNDLPLDNPGGLGDFDR